LQHKLVRMQDLQFRLLLAQLPLSQGFHRGHNNDKVSLKLGEVLLWEPV
jgi:hypothetical protein